jgi:adenylate cyclase
MAADEAGTLATLRRCREAMATLIERHDGRIVNTWGDAVIAEFASVVEAVQCAVETQQELSSHNGGLPEPQRMKFRIGINLGDVMVEGDDVYGDGVNIAARLQELAEPGGILISGPVYEQVHNKLSIGFDCLGQQRLKNVANPVTGYRVLQGGAPSRPQASRPEATRGPQGPPPRVESGFSRAWNGTRGYLVSAP